jgi:hypothetical protein
MDFMYQEMLDASIRSKELDYKVKSFKGADGSIVTPTHKRPVGFLENFETGNELNESTFLEELKMDLSEADTIDRVPSKGISEMPKLPLLIMLDALFGGGGGSDTGAASTDSETSSSKHSYSSYISMGKYT